MESKRKTADFFMGANSPGGFYSLYDELKDPRLGFRSFLLKGGAGTGKSRLLREIASRFEDRETLMERIHCSSDPDSLDGVILHKGKCSIVDATPPHVIEPAFPGGFETVINLCEYFDEDKMEHRLLDTVKLQRANGECHRKCQRLIHAADILLKDNASYIERCTDFNKIDSLAKRLSDTELISVETAAKEHRRLLSAVTNAGVLTYTKTVPALCSKIYVIKDDYGVSSARLLNQIKDAALNKGHHIFACYCPFSPDYKLEHLLIPHLDLAFVTQSRFNDFEEVVPHKVIKFSRFTDIEKMAERKQYLRFNRKAAIELIDAAVQALQDAKEIHDQLERQYTDAVDFSKVNEKTQEILEKIERRYPSSC